MRATGFDLASNGNRSKGFYLTRMEPLKKKIDVPILSFDVENDPIDGKMKVMHFFGEASTRKIKREQIDVEFLDRQEALNFLSRYDGASKDHRVPFILSGHNMKYDRWFVHELFDDETIIADKNNAFITGNLYNGIQVIDTFRILQGSVESWIDTLKLEEKYGIRKIQMPEGMFPNDLSLQFWQERCANDARATYYITQHAIDMMNYFHAGMCVTIGQLGLKVLRQNLDYSVKRIGPNAQFINDYERLSYRGARNEVFDRSVISCVSYDKNATYPSLMSKYLYPDPEKWTFIESGKAWEKHLDNHKFGGIFNVIIRVPEAHICPVMYVHPKTKRRMFPWGEFRAVLTKPELQLALNHGCEVIECQDYIVYSKMIPIFKKFADMIWDYRTRYPKTDPMNKIAKLLGNTPYGKMGQRNPSEGQKYVGKISDCPIDLDNKKIMPFKKGMGELDEYIMFRGSETEDSSHTIPVLASYITSYARIELFEALIAHGKDSIYCDTDSVHIREGTPIDLDIGDGLGQWKYEWKKNLKHYSSKLVFDVDIGKFIASKGIPLNSLFTPMNDGKIIAEFQSPAGIYTAICKGIHPCSWLNKIRTISDKEMKRKWNRDGTSVPVHVIDRN